jgi:hypothetical protein
MEARAERSVNIIGSLMDMATPSNILTGPIKAVPKIGKYLSMGTQALNPSVPLTQAALRKMGLPLWKTVFSHRTAEAEKAGNAINPADVLVRENVWSPTGKGLKTETARAAEDIFDRRAAMETAAKSKGAIADMDSAETFLRGLKAKYTELGKVRPEVAETIREIDGMLEQLSAQKPRGAVPATPDKVVPAEYLVDEPLGPTVVRRARVEPGKPAQPAFAGLNPEESSKLKTYLRRSQPSSAYHAHAPTPVKQDLLTAEAAGLQKATEESMGVLGANAPDEYARHNAELGSIIGTDKVGASQLAREQVRPAVTAVDLLYGMGMGAADPQAGATAAVIKKLYDIMRLQAPRSTVGAGMLKFGSTPLTKPLIGAGARSAWSLFDDSEKKRQQ